VVGAATPDTRAQRAPSGPSNGGPRRAGTQPQQQQQQHQQHQQAPSQSFGAPTSTAAWEDIPIASSSSNAQIEAEARATEQASVQCPTCGRSFNTAAFQKHRGCVVVVVVVVTLSAAAKTAGG
jgi:hypothetical protein